MRWFHLLAAVTFALAAASCDGCEKKKPGQALPELPVPPDPPEIACGEPQLTPITSVHEHVLDAKHLPVLLETAKELGVEKVNLLPFWNDHVYEQNEAQIAAMKAQPDRVSAFVSVDAMDDEAVSRLERLAAAGAKGVKLYSGYRRTYEPGELTGPNAHRIYAFLEERGLPLLMHTNGFYFEKELREVLDEHPKLILLCPHYCLLSGKPGRLHALLSDYPNLYTDVSFGSFNVLYDGVSRISKDPEGLRKVIRTHRHRVAFGMDNVAGKSSTTETLLTTSRTYREMLEKETFHFFHKDWKGLHLDPCTLESIYRINPERFLAGKPPLTD